MVVPILQAMKAEEGQEANMLQVAGVVTILEILVEEDIITQYRGNYQSRHFVPSSYSSQLDYATQDHKGPQAQAELPSQSQAPSGNRF